MYWTPAKMLLFANVEKYVPQMLMCFNEVGKWMCFSEVLQLGTMRTQSGMYLWGYSYFY